MQPGSPKYWAFISYSHADSRAAGWLQRALETYRIPKRLLGRSTPWGPIPPYLKPIFRDREEMQAGADLGAVVREALAQSRVLIVICSPDAARSPWVSREIVEFKRIHGESRVLALIVAGEPFASRTPGRDGEECFPEALRFAVNADGTLDANTPLEPMAADARPQGDGRRLATLRLVAGMLGGDISVDELVRRDAQRRARRMAGIAATSLAGMGVMTVLAVVAIQSRTEAQNQRAQAEGLIEFMLGDLKGRLKPVGRLDALDAVGGKALAYYAAQDPAHLDAPSLGRRSRALHLIGEIHEQRGRLDDAHAAFTSAATTTQRLLEQAPTDGQRLFDHAQSVYWVGYIARRRGQAQKAQEAFLRYRELAERLVRLDPGKPEWRLETAYANQNLGVVQLDRGDLDAALKSFTAARDVLAQLVADRPALGFELTDAYGWIAKVHEAAGDYGAAIETQRGRLSMLGMIPDAARDRRVRRHVSNAHFELARLQLFLGEPAAALTHAVSSLEESDALVAADPANLSWLAEATFARLRVAETQLALGRLAAAQASHSRAGADAARLIARDNTKIVWQVNLQGIALARKAQIARAAGSGLSAEEFESFLARIRTLENSGTQLAASQSEIVAEVELALGDVLGRLGRPGEARERWSAAVSRLRSSGVRETYPVLTQIARLQLRLGNSSEARALAARVESSRFRHPSYAGLRDELALPAAAGRTTTILRRD
jgi:tetratricopeptide (TPR) repeat protein